MRDAAALIVAGIRRAATGRAAEIVPEDEDMQTFRRALEVASNDALVVLVPEDVDVALAELQVPPVERSTGTR